LRNTNGLTKLVGPFSFMLHFPNIESEPDGSLFFSQGALFERSLCLLLGFAALVFCVSLGFKGASIGEVDFLAFILMFGPITRALSLPLLEARFDAQTQMLFYEWEQWGWKREHNLRFTEIQSLRRVECYETGEMGLKVRLRLVTQEQELSLWPGSLSLRQADEVEERLRVLLPMCPINPPIQVSASNKKRPLLNRNTFQMTSGGGLIVRRFVPANKVESLAWAFFIFMFLLCLFGSMKEFGKSCLVFLVLASPFTVAAVQSKEWQFCPQEKKLILLTNCVGVKKQRVFDFADIRAVRRELHLFKPEDGPSYELFRLFLQIGEANEDLMLSPKDLTLVQADELERAVREVLGDAVPCSSSDATAS